MHRGGRGGGEYGGRGGCIKTQTPQTTLPCRQAMDPWQLGTQAAQQAQGLTDKHDQHDGAPHQLVQRRLDQHCPVAGGLIGKHVLVQKLVPAVKEAAGQYPGAR